MVERPSPSSLYRSISCVGIRYQLDTVFWCIILLGPCVDWGAISFGKLELRGVEHDKTQLLEWSISHGSALLGMSAALSLDGSILQIRHCNDRRALQDYNYNYPIAFAGIRPKK